MAEVTVTVVGRVGRPPILRTGARGDWATFSVATNPRWRQGTEWVDGPTSWFDVNVDGDLAHHVVQSIDRGHQVIVHGTIAIREVGQQDGGKAKYVNVKATAVGPDLRWGTTRFTTAERPASTPAQPQPDPQPAAPQQSDGGWGEAPAAAPQPVAAPVGWGSSLGAGEDTPF